MFAFFPSAFSAFIRGYTFPASCPPSGKTTQVACQEWFAAIGPKPLPTASRSRISSRNRGVYFGHGISVDEINATFDFSSLRLRVSSAAGGEEFPTRDQLIRRTWRLPFSINPIRTGFSPAFLRMARDFSTSCLRTTTTMPMPMLNTRYISSRSTLPTRWMNW